MWTDIRQEIERARRELGLTPVQFRPLGLAEWPAVEKRVNATFADPNYKSRQAVLLWTRLRPDLPRTGLSDVDAAVDEEKLQLLRALRQPDEPVFFFAQEGISDPKIWWYQARSPAAWTIVEALGPQARRLQEWGVVDCQYQWILFINHSDHMLFCGTALIERLRNVASVHQLRME
jgi:hypothetical protein